MISQSALYLEGQTWLACIGGGSELDILLPLTIQFGVLHMPLLIQAPVFSAGEQLETFRDILYGQPDFAAISSRSSSQIPGLPSLQS